MWFGDLVTMRWWDDLWLNESFAEWASHWCNTRRDPLHRRVDDVPVDPQELGLPARTSSPRTHPVYCEMPDVEAVEVNFDGITYAKGASVIKQLVAYVGIDAVRHRPARLLRASTPGATPPSTTCSPRWRRPPAASCATFAAAVAGDRAGQHAAPGGRDRPRTARTQRSSSLQEAPAELPDAAHPPHRRRPLRPRRRRAGPPRAARGRRRRRAHRARRAGRRPGGRRAAAQRRRPDLRQAAAGRAVDGHRGRAHRAASTRRWPGRCAGPPPGTWSATPSWPPATTSRWSAPGCRAETDINLVTATLRQAQLARGPVRRPGLGADRLGTARRHRPRRAGRGRAGQRLPARLGAGLYASAARTDEDLAILRGWLDGVDVPEGLSLIGDFRWHLIEVLSAEGKINAELIEVEHAADPTAAGDRESGHSDGATADGRGQGGRLGGADQLSADPQLAAVAPCCKGSTTRPSWR